MSPNCNFDVKCWCRNCNQSLIGWAMFLCPTCGNKRCPRATNHELGCTNSNELGQPGSAYGALPKSPNE